MARNWSIHQLDVKNAFLHEDMKETVYLHQPHGFVDSRTPHYVCPLPKALYGLKHQRFAHFLLHMGFVITKSDYSLSTYSHGSNCAYLLLYVDDNILTTSSNALWEQIITRLKTEFLMSDLGPLSYFLGIAVTQTPSYMLVT